MFDDPSGSRLAEVLSLLVEALVDERRSSMNVKLMSPNQGVGELSLKVKPRDALQQRPAGSTPGEGRVGQGWNRAALCVLRGAEQQSLLDQLAGASVKSGIAAADRRAATAHLPVVADRELDDDGPSELAARVVATAQPTADPLRRG